MDVIAIIIIIIYLLNKLLLQNAKTKVSQNRLDGLTGRS